MAVNLPYQSQDAGIPYQWSDSINPADIDLFSGDLPPKVTRDYQYEVSQTILARTVVGLNASNKIVPATNFFQAAKAATGVLTFSGVGTAADTITIGAGTYTLRAAPTTVANEVKIGASAAETAANLAAAINLGAGAGTLYGSLTTEHPTVMAESLGAGIVGITAKTPGTAGNALASTEAGTNTSFGAATLTGGEDQFGAKAMGVSVIKVVTDADDTSGAPIYIQGCINPDALIWHASFDSDAKKAVAFDGAPSPTSILLRKVQNGAKL
ncbi:hypothetical protein [Mesorhizobium sp. B2-8-9]|uniref:hypothetical protein n=1 Tax=Mesorhizobium sp. B2-8-9 TaxID=2589899 RepID=UPI00112A409A|nr:hypothetical protein [Mesorhizobium sp. B2-8-9]TPI86355.1 hypothetical protein FJ423_00595 [Mesorhizobium sp. B2-8-9]